MIDEQLQEQASLHVLGALSPEEAREFKQKMTCNPELRAFVGSLSVATSAIAGNVPCAKPPPEVRTQLLAQIARSQKVPKPAGRDSKPAFPLFEWILPTLSVGLAVICLMLSYQNNHLKQTVLAASNQIRSLNAMAAALQSATNGLQQTVFALSESNRLANLQITLLQSHINGSPDAMAATLWDQSDQKGVFVVRNLPPAPSSRDYQLWVLENGTTPVDAGVVHVDENGSGRVDFQPVKHIQIAAKFAVTEEVHGGSPTPTLKNLVLAGI